MRWERALNGHFVAHFVFPREDLRIKFGDELLLRYDGELHKAWEGIGTVRTVCVCQRRQGPPMLGPPSRVAGGVAMLSPNRRPSTAGALPLPAPPFPHP